MIANHVNCMKMKSFKLNILDWTNLQKCSRKLVPVI